MLNEALFSSKTDQWSTPRAFAAKYVEKYGITLDVCADENNAVVPNFFSKEQDGLSQVWTGVVWMNPPYGREIGLWVEKAARSAAAGATVVCLLPARTDTRWFQSYCIPVLNGTKPGTVHFVPGRLKFGDAKSGAPFPSVVVVFEPEKK